MQKWLIGIGVVFSMLVCIGIAILIQVRSGPTAPPPTADPFGRLNQERAGIADNAADLYAAAFASLYGKEKAKWTEGRGWQPGDTVPDEAVAWVAANQQALEDARRASAGAALWFPLRPNSAGVLPFFDEQESMRQLVRLLVWQARLAAERRDLEELVETLHTIDRIGRHVAQTPILMYVQRGASYREMAQELVLAPYAWTELSPGDRSAYAIRIAPCLEAPPTFANAIAVEQELRAWNYLRGKPPLQVRILAPDARVCAELQRYFAPYRELAALPIEQQTDPTLPLLQRIAALDAEKAPPSNVARRVAQFYVPLLRSPIQRRARLIAMQRGNLTAIEIFALRDCTGQFPDTLDDVTGDFTIDPYSGQPFIYRLTDDGFTLYSVGLDRDDDGGKYHPEFGEQSGTGTQPHPPPDGDFVFWPIPAGE